MLIKIANKHIVAFASLAALMFFAQTSQAAVTVIGGGLAKDCYHAAKFKNSLSSKDVKTCNKALDSGLNAKNRAATYANRGIIHMNMSRHKAALSDYARALIIRPELTDIHTNRGAALIHMARYDEALEVLNTALETSLQKPHAAHYNRALAREKLGDLQGAYEDFAMALELNPDFIRAKDQMDRFIVKKISS